MTLPRVLLIGDSISMGYTPVVQEALAGQTEVHHPDDNCGPTIRGLQRLDAWLGDRPWDLIHFNFGLHDMRHDVPDRGGERARQVPIDQYQKNLEQLVRRLAKTGAALIWATTTPVPEGAANRVAGDELRYNAVALSIVKAHGIPVNDLHALVAPKLAEYQRPANVHFENAGNVAMGRQVADVIRNLLADPGQCPGVGR